MLNVQYFKIKSWFILEFKKIVKPSAFIRTSFELGQRAFTTTSVFNLRFHGFGGICESPEIVWKFCVNCIFFRSQYLAFIKGSVIRRKKKTSHNNSSYKIIIFLFILQIIVFLTSSCLLSGIFKKLSLCNSSLWLSTVSNTIFFINLWVSKKNWEKYRILFREAFWIDVICLSQD